MRRTTVRHVVRRALLAEACILIHGVDAASPPPASFRVPGSWQESSVKCANGLPARKLRPSNLGEAPPPLAEPLRHCDCPHYEGKLFTGLSTGLSTWSCCLRICGIYATCPGSCGPRWIPARRQGRSLSTKALFAPAHRKTTQFYLHRDLNWSLKGTRARHAKPEPAATDAKHFPCHWGGAARTTRTPRPPSFIPKVIHRDIHWP